MIAVSGATRDEVEELLASVHTGSTSPPSSRPSTARAAWCSAVPRPRCAASPPRSSSVRRRGRQIEAKLRGGRAFAPDPGGLPVALGFHHPALAPAVALVRGWAEACGLDAGLAENLAHAICVDTVDWPRQLTDAVGPATGTVDALGRRPRPRRHLRQHDRSARCAAAASP